MMSYYKTRKSEAVYRGRYDSKYIGPLLNLLSYTPGDYVLNSFVRKQQLNILSVVFHIESEVPVSSTSLPSTIIPSTSIHDVVKFPEHIKRKKKN